MMQGVKQRSVQLASLVLMLAAWHVLSIFVGQRILPPPGAVFPEAWRILANGDFVTPVVSSLGRLFAGFILSLLVGLTFGIASARMVKFGIASAAVFTIIMTTPSLLIVFVGLIILGQTNTMVIAAAALIVFPFVAVPIRDAMKDVDQDILGMADSFKIGTLRKVTDVYIPYLVPPILAAARIGFALSWKIVLLSEVLGFSSGIGYRISSAYFQYDLRRLIAWLLIFVVIVIVIEQLIRAGEHAVVKWR